MINLAHRFARRHRLASIHTISILRCHWLAADTRNPPLQGAASSPPQVAAREQEGMGGCDASATLQPVEIVGNSATRASH
ncbi:unnamed protein product [Lota lota]